MARASGQGEAKRSPLFARRLFFFISQEFTRTKTAATTQRVNEPTAAERTGDFSKSVGSNGVSGAVSLRIARYPANMSFLATTAPSTPLT